MLQLAPLPPGLTIQNYYAPLHIIAPNNGTFTFGPATFRNPDGTLMDFTTATGKMQVRRSPTDPVPLLDFGVTAGTVMTFGGALGTLIATATETVMEALTLGDYDWDLLITIGAVTTPWFAGVFRVLQGVSR